MDLYKNNVEIVIARYNEDLYWLNEYPFNQFEYIVYNKGDNDNFVKNNVKKIIRLPNVGMCDHTYLYHIITNYNNLSNIVVFFPGSVNMGNKKPKAISILNNIINSNYTQAHIIGTYCNSVKDTFYNFTLTNYTCGYGPNKIKNNKNILYKCKIRPYGKWYDYFLKNKIGHWYMMNGIFSVDKRDIIQHPIDNYKLIIQSVNRHSNPEAAHYIERSWGVIFYPLIYTIKNNG